MKVISSLPIEHFNHLYSFIPPKNETEHEILKDCFKKMFKVSPKILEIIEKVTPFRDDIMLALYEALNLPPKETIGLHKNVLLILEQIGDHNTVIFLLDAFDEYIDKFDASLTNVLNAIATREGEETKNLIVARYTDFLTSIDVNPLKRLGGYNHRKKLIAVLISLKRMGTLNDTRLIKVLEKYVSEIHEFREEYNLALFILAKNNNQNALDILNRNKLKNQNSSIHTPQKTKAIFTPIENGEDYGYITIFLRNQKNDNNETPYVFEYDNPLLLFLKRDIQDYGEATFIESNANKTDLLNIAQRYIEYNQPDKKIENNDLQECYNTLIRHFNFENWGFQLSYIEPGKLPTIIYSSEWCKVMFDFTGSGEQHDRRTYLNVYYGRLHAPNNDWTILHNHEEHWCWHRDILFLKFLDGLSPQESFLTKYDHPLRTKYRESEYANELSNRSPAEYTVGMTLEIWKHYGQKLFKIFDLRNPELWVKYESYLNEIYKLEQPVSYSWTTYNKIY